MCRQRNPLVTGLQAFCRLDQGGGKVSVDWTKRWQGFCVSVLICCRDCRDANGLRVCRTFHSNCRLFTADGIDMLVILPVFALRGSTDLIVTVISTALTVHVSGGRGTAPKTTTTTTTTTTTKQRPVYSLMTCAEHSTVYDAPGQLGYHEYIKSFLLASYLRKTRDLYRTVCVER